MRSIKSALLWPILTILLVSNSGCAFIPSWFKKDDPPKVIEVFKKPIERAPLNIIQPEPIQTKPLTWIVVTPENAEKVFNDLKDDKVLFAITSEGYQDLAMLMAQLRVFIYTQRQIIIKYKEYYETPRKEESKE